MKYFHQLTSIQNHLILLDIDGTLTHDGSHELTSETLQKLQELKKSNTIYLCSNKNNHERDHIIAKQAQIHNIDSDLKKPTSKLLQFTKNPNKLPLLVIGDKTWPDYFFAKNINASFIKVKRITSPQDPTIIKLTYLLDNLLSLFFPTCKKRS